MSLYRNSVADASTAKIIDISTYNRLSHKDKDIKTEKNSNNNNYNNYPGARACAYAREGLTEEIEGMRELYGLYCDAFQRDRVAAVVRREMAAAIEAGAEPSLIAYAIEMAEIAPNPTWAYARAVIKRCMADKCRTYADCEARADRMRSARKPQASKYTERQITDADFESGFYVDVMKRGTEHDKE